MPSHAVRRLSALVLVLAVLPSGCAAPGGQRFTGGPVPRPPSAGPAGPLPVCRAQTATLMVKDGHFAFTPRDSSLVLRGTVAPDGHFAASLNTQPPGKPPYVLSAAGQIAGGTAVVDYTNPGCATRFALTLQDG